MIIRRVDPFSLAKLHAVIGALLGFLVALVWGLLFAASAAFALNRGGGMPIGPAGGAAPFAGMMGLGAILFVFVLPIAYGILGFVGGLLGALIFNVACGMTGGLEVDVELQGELYESEDRG